VQRIAVSDGVAFAINAPTNAAAGQDLTVVVKNLSGGVMGAITWNGAFQMAAWTNPANNFLRAITFAYISGYWLEVSRTPADVPTPN
jgi:hypothetical protein